jgi:hypothetical protein
MAKDDRVQNGILGDIRPEPPDREDMRDQDQERVVGEEFDDRDDGVEDEEPMPGGYRDEDESEGGGSRNYRQGTGASGGDIGNRPE